ncbi:hypothetical protein FA13DRAFT_1804548 [Coprinellus micaceus]|uniref:Uncharacterized protein n=1 Tax=Coprinellus micaceus TaxID=71717 RepID=A0A4Y7S678_COPMI|nr:hypothetical protein FA13DRAFT_1804548 [Coprinellus micaceus]
MPKASPSPHYVTPVRSRLIVPSRSPPPLPHKSLSSAKYANAGAYANEGNNIMPLELTAGTPLGSAVGGNHDYNIAKGGRSDASNDSSAHRSPKPSSIALLKSNSKLVMEVESLKLKIQSLERSQGWYRQKAEGKAEKLRDVKVELEEAHNQAIEMEEKVEEMQESVRVLERYRRWWLTEYHSLQALIALIPDRRDVEAIASSADERFRWHYATL